jgi:hypothetical protein
MVTDQDQYGNYRAYLFTPPAPLPPFTTNGTQLVVGNPNSLGTTGPANSFAFDTSGLVTYFTANGTTWTAIGGSSSGANFLGGTGSPVGVVSSTVIGQTYADITNPAAVNFWTSTALGTGGWYEVAGS